MTSRPYADQGASDFISPYPLERCRALLESAMDSSPGLRGERPVIGRIDRDRLTARKRIFYRNSFQVQLTAVLREQDGRTYFSCRVAMHPFVTVFMVVWLGGVLMAGGTIWIVSLVELFSGQSKPDASTWLGTVIPAAMACSGVGMIWLGRALSAGDRQFLTDFVRRTVNAEPA